MLVEIYRFWSPPWQKQIDVAHRVQREKKKAGCGGIIVILGLALFF